LIIIVCTSLFFRNTKCPSSTISYSSFPITQSQLGLPFPGSIKPKLLLESCPKSFFMAKKKNKKRPTQTTASSENSDATLIQTMADLAISGALPYRPRPVAGPQDPLYPLQRRRRPRRNIVGEFDRYFGEVSKLENWQRLCVDIGIEDDLTSIKQCKKVYSSSSILHSITRSELY
jgi:hypothetical protein